MGFQMQQFPATTEGTLRQLQLIHLCLVVSVVLYLFMMKIMELPNSGPPSASIFWSLCVESVLALGFGQSIRSKKLGAAFEALQTKPDDPAALAQWHAGVIISDCLAESVALCGLAIHYLGGTSRQVAPFFVAGFLALLLWWPRRP
jgi:hypothetical protein